MAYKPITDQQVRLYMSNLEKHSQRLSAARAGFSERTARRFDANPTLPSNRKIAHGRTVADPLEGYWEEDLVPLLERDSTLQAIPLLRHLQELHPRAFPDDRIRRTLERRVRQWRALNGPEWDIIFRQTPEPGLMAQSDFNHAEELGVSIAGQPLPHLLYHFVMVYSRWEHVAVVLGGESFTARHSLSFCSWKDRKVVAADLRRIYSAPTAAMAEAELDAFEEKWAGKYASIAPAWRRAWAAVIPFFAFDLAIRKIIYTTNAIESLNRVIRKSIKTRGSFPTDEAATKLIYLAIRSFEKDG